MTAWKKYFVMSYSAVTALVNCPITTMTFKDISPFWTWNIYLTRFSHTQTATYFGETLENVKWILLQFSLKWGLWEYIKVGLLTCMEYELNITLKKKNSSTEFKYNESPFSFILNADVFKSNLPGDTFVHCNNLFTFIYLWNQRTDSFSLKSGSFAVSLFVKIIYWI